MTDQDIFAIRERFLADHELVGGVREQISKSWRRSKALDIAVDQIELPFVREPNLESPLVTAAQPVLERLAEELAGEPMSIILTSDDGVVLRRIAAMSTLRDDLDSVQLAPGFSYSEEFVGTNGIGTTLATRKPTVVVGGEHYAGVLGNLSCAGVPIFHPVSGTLLGALDLTGWVEHRAGLMMSVATLAAKQIEDALMSGSSAGHVELFHAYLAQRRRNPGAMVLALADDLVLMDQRLRRTVEPADQSALLEHASDCIGGAVGSMVEVLPSGITVRLTRLERLSDDSMAMFAVRKVDEQPAAAPVRRAVGGSLPGLVGRSASWRLTCTELHHALRTRLWVAVAGEPGAGRSAALRSALASHRSSSPRVFEAADLMRDGLDELEDELADDDFSVMVRDVDALAVPVMQSLSELLSENTDRGWVAVTLRNDPSPDVESLILPHFARTVTVPALRHRIEDLHELVPLILRQLTHGDDLSLTSAAMRQLSSFGWPGNVAQLRDVLQEVVRRQRRGVVDVADLPAICRTHGTHTLTALESMERDAIVRSLTENGFDKQKAAHSLGISRATIYRRIKQFGIATS